MAHAVARHNSKILQSNEQQAAQQPGCNCQGGTDTCLVQGKCQTDSVMYRATVTEVNSGQVETYTGVTGNTFKQRLGGHRSDIKLRKNRHKSTLADHIWTLKDEGKDYNLKWNLVERAPAFNPTTRKCRVCLKEIFLKYTIGMAPQQVQLDIQYLQAQNTKTFNECKDLR